MGQWLWLEMLTLHRKIHEMVDDHRRNLVVLMDWKKAKYENLVAYPSRGYSTRQTVAVVVFFPCSFLGKNCKRLLFAATLKDRRISIYSKRYQFLCVKVNYLDSEAAEDFVAGPFHIYRF